jgi:peptidoglycan/LPS O-acetylase OafA/YrhL
MEADNEQGRFSPREAFGLSGVFRAVLTGLLILAALYLGAGALFGFAYDPNELEWILNALGAAGLLVVASTIACVTPSKGASIVWLFGAMICAVVGLVYAVDLATGWNEYDNVDRILGASFLVVLAASLIGVLTAIAHGKRG